MKEESRSEGMEVSNEAIAALAAQAVSEIEGVAVYQHKAPGSITSRVKREFMHKGVKVSREDDSCRLGLYLKVDYGARIPTLAREVRKKVKSYVEGLTEIKVEDVEVTIEDVEPPE
jgi:uncharacterized alkaline shock family protein YloU